MSNKPSRIMCVINGIIIGFMIAMFYFAKENQLHPNLEYTHWELEQKGYYYCPYCGEVLKEGE